MPHLSNTSSHSSLTPLSTIPPFAVSAPITLAWLLIWKHPGKLLPKDLCTVGSSTWNTHPTYFTWLTLTSFKSVLKCVMQSPLATLRLQQYPSQWSVSPSPLNFSPERFSEILFYLSILLIINPFSRSVVVHGFTHRLALIPSTLNKCLLGICWTNACPRPTSMLPLPWSCSQITPSRRKDDSLPWMTQDPEHRVHYTQEFQGIQEKPPLRPMKLGNVLIGSWRSYA